MACLYYRGDMVLSSSPLPTTQVDRAQEQYRAYCKLLGSSEWHGTLTLDGISGFSFQVSGVFISVLGVLWRHWVNLYNTRSPRLA